MASKNVNEFMKELSAITGKYGDELFSYVLEKVGKPKSNAELPKKDNFFPQNEVKEFVGTTMEIADLYLMLGGKENVAKFFGCCCPELVCSHMATVYNVSEFYWTKPVKIQTKDKKLQNGWARYGVIWNEEKRLYADVESKLISREEGAQ